MATRPTRPAQTGRSDRPAAPRRAPKPAAPERAAKPAAPERPTEPVAPEGSRNSRPAALHLAAAAQAVEAAGLAVAGVFAAVSTADGRSYQLASGIALTLIAFATAAGFAAIAVGLAQTRSWSRTPTAITQLFVIIAGITLLQGHRPEWGVPALVLAGLCVAGLVTPASLRALNRPDVPSQAGSPGP
jgi:hypothetical protein